MNLSHLPTFMGLVSAIALTWGDVNAAEASTLSTIKTRAAKDKPVFFHYLVGTVHQDHCTQDITDAKALGVDGFALNLNTVNFTENNWANQTVTDLFAAAKTIGDFELFFSFDMSPGYFSAPSDFADFLEGWVANDAYYLYDSKPLVSTFNGGSISNDIWQSELIAPLAAAGTPIYFLPSFQDIVVSSDFFDTFPSADGFFNWDVWPENNAVPSLIIVPDTEDITLQNAAAAATSKTFMMGLSPLQYKNTGGNNWYRRGEQNLEYRFGQVLSLQPDFIELITWNDAGESHYMGNSWPESIDGSDINNYTEDYDHTGYWQILPSFVNAWKSGATDTTTMYPTNGAQAQGTFWHHTMLAGAACTNPPQGQDTAQDWVTVVVLLAKDAVAHTLTVTSGGNIIGTNSSLVPGFNKFSAEGMVVGTVEVSVVETATGALVVAGTGPLEVVDETGACNYNFQVVGLTAS